MRPVFAPAALAFVAVAVVLVALAGRNAPPVDASFHVMRIYSVMGGQGGSDDIQFVELRMASGNQNLVGSAQICFYDGTGTPWARFDFPDNVSGDDNQDSILIGSAAMDGAWSTAGSPDFVFSAANTTAINVAADVNAPIPVPAGKITYGGGSSCANISNLDSFAYGSGYSGPVTFGTKFATDLATSAAQGFRLTADIAPYPPVDNSTDYMVQQCLHARNNAGVDGPVNGGCPTNTPGPTPSPTPVTTPAPTSTPTVTPGATVAPTPTGTPIGTPGPALQGDADCDGGVDVDDGLEIVEAVADVGVVHCSERADVTCDQIDLLDALGIFKFVAGVSTAAPPCTPIGQPLDN